MSQTSSHDDAALEQDLEALLAAPAEPIQHSAATLQALEAQVLANRFRTLLKQALKKEKMTARSLAHKLGVSPSAISRQLHGDGDMKVFTAAVLAHAMNHTFGIDLLPNRASGAARSNWLTTSASTKTQVASPHLPVSPVSPQTVMLTSSTGAMRVVSVKREAA